ncbi:MAG: hypothetical protein A2Z99_05220 [Treponema sp. GWB1_62_6]|nr:MAG: hypothetical protein A2Z99_05220 [Treponema sp. GWB1_62_6]
MRQKDSLRMYVLIAVTIGSSERIPGPSIDDQTEASHPAPAQRRRMSDLRYQNLCHGFKHEIAVAPEDETTLEADIGSECEVTDIVFVPPVLV